jgi:hypothetical protein
MVELQAVMMAQADQLVTFMPAALYQQVGRHWYLLC